MAGRGRGSHSLLHKPLKRGMGERLFSPIPGKKSEPVKKSPGRPGRLRAVLRNSPAAQTLALRPRSPRRPGTRFFHILLVVLALSLAAWAAPATARVVVGDPNEAAARIARFPASRGTASEPRRLARLSELYLAYNLAEGPETATRWGDTGAEDRWYDLSPEASQRRKQTARALLAAVRSIDRRKLGPEEAVSR